ncbi:MAG: TetR/AcrR family transcriptional regulator [Sporolactobacillus sp.]
MRRAIDYQFTNQNIINTAKQLFMEEGFKAVTTRQIAKSCHLTQPALYHHFKDKQAIYLAVLKQITLDIRQSCAAVDFSQSEIEQVLFQIISIFTQQYPANLLMMVHDIMNSMDPSHRQMLFDMWENTFVTPFKQLFANWQACGILRPDVDHEASARFCLAAIVPLTSAHFLKLSKNRQSERMMSVIDFLLHGLVR